MTKRLKLFHKRPTTVGSLPCISLTSGSSVLVLVLVVSFVSCFGDFGGGGADDDDDRPKDEKNDRRTDCLGGGGGGDGFASRSGAVLSLEEDVENTRADNFFKEENLFEPLACGGVLGGFGSASSDDSSEEVLVSVGGGGVLLPAALRLLHRNMLDSLGLSLNSGRDNRLFSAAFLDANPSRLDRLPRDISDAFGGGSGGDGDDDGDFDDFGGAGATTSVLTRFDENSSRKD